jgi:hypothetical protein
MFKKILEKKVSVTFDIKNFVKKHTKEEYIRLILLNISIFFKKILHYLNFLKTKKMFFYCCNKNLINFFN